MAVYSGALQPKKKSELQEIAAALRLSELGTKDELQARIKRHLDAHQDALEDDPTFAGLLGRRKRSVQPSGRFAPDEKPRSARRSVTALDPVVEATPVRDRDMHDISTFLKAPFSPVVTPRAPADPVTPSSLPPLPPSSPAKSIAAALPVVAAAAATSASASQARLRHTLSTALASLRAFLSSSTHLWLLTATFEALYLLGIVIPWASLHLSLGPLALSLPYPPLAALRAPALYAVLLHWALPTLVLPFVLGTLISFNPSLAPGPSPSTGPPSSNSPAPPSTSTPLPPLDPLTASITRLALALAYPYPALSTRAGIAPLDVLGAHWRILASSVGLAFAFAEAILGTPHAAARSLAHQQRRLLLAAHEEEDEDANARALTPVRHALMPAPSSEDVDEVD